MNFERVNGYPFVKSKMGDKPIGMLLDTGSRECILDASFYKECGGKPEMILPAEPLCSPSGNLETTGKTLFNLTIGSNVLRVPVVLADISRYLSVIADELDFPIVGLLGTKFFHRWKFYIDFDNEMIYSYEPIAKDNATKNEVLESFQGKEIVQHVVSGTGSESWLTYKRSFGDEAYAKGACKLNTVEDEHKNKHLLFLFNSKDEEVGRYYLGKSLQGKSPSELVEIKANLEFFDSWNPESKSWVPCVGLSQNIQRGYFAITRSSNINADVAKEIKEEDFELINKTGIGPIYARIENKKRKVAIVSCKTILSMINGWEEHWLIAKRCYDRSCFYGYNIINEDLSEIQKTVLFWKKLSEELEKHEKGFEEAFPEKYHKYSDGNLERLWEWCARNRYSVRNVTGIQGTDAETAIMSTLEHGDGDNVGF